MMMVALLFHRRLKRIQSCRKIAAACTDDLGAIVICGGRPQQLRWNIYALTVAPHS